MSSSGLKFVFVCDTITPGRGGVGDYTAALAGELTRQQHPVAVASLMEQDDGTADYPFAHIQLKASQSWSEKAAALRAWLAQEAPDVISLQYVPYAYHPRGLPFGLCQWLKSIAGSAQFHIMFHELWVASEQGATKKNCIIGAIQKRLIAKMLQSLNPVAVHTTNLVYQELLRRLGQNASILPLFSNIVPVPNPIAPWALLQSKGLKVNPDNRDSWLIAALFGTLHPSWNPQRAVALLEEAAALSQKHPVLLLAGRNGAQADYFRSELAEKHPEITVVTTGKLDVPELSSVLRIPDFGFSAAPWALVGKSSASLALLSHGVPVVFTDDRWRLRQGPTPIPDHIDGCYLDSPDIALRIAKGLPKPTGTPTIEEVATNLYQLINTNFRVQ